MKGVAVAPQPRAAEAGAAALSMGGNAFDAAIATALMQVVTDPHMCGLGGFGCATYVVDGQCWHAGFHARAGSRATPDMWVDGMQGRMELGGYALFEDHRNNLGHRSVGTPGTVAGLAELHRYARLPWSELIAPAAALAREGFLAPEYMFDLAARLSTPGFPSSEERFAYTPDSAALWLRPADRKLKQPGEQWSNPDLAATLERLGHAGPRDFYAGDLARQIAAELERGDGLVTLKDLGAYRVRVSRPVTGEYRGLRVFSASPPSSGVTVVQMLQILDCFAPMEPGRPETIVRLAGVMREAFAERARAVADPECVSVPVASLLSQEWAEAAAERLRRGKRSPETASVGVPGTTHVSTYDEAGNAVAFTHTLSLYSGVVVPSTGIMLNSAMDLFDPVPGRPNSIAPGKARLSGMAPTIVFDGQRPALVTGAPGTNAIVTCIVQTIVNAVDGEFGPLEAVAAPRVHCEGGPVFVEGRVSQAAQQALRDAGFDVRPTPGNYVPSMGRNQLVVIRRDGQFEGASDPRRDGGVAAYS
ncbi:MAG: gamma-glutamyltransferase [Chloroflexi bacterium]|nr:gamma-glutamyltransferase [Chloroflexota bacterium]